MSVEYNGEANSQDEKPLVSAKFFVPSPWHKASILIASALGETFWAFVGKYLI